MSKIPTEVDNPIDNVLIKIWDPFTDLFHNLGFTPNMFTTISLVFGIIAGIYLYRNKYSESMICFAVAYFFDCADGYFARKYGMETAFGDFYDHISDWFKVGLIMSLIYIKSPANFLKILVICILFMIPLFMQIACQEKYYSDTKESIVNQPIMGQFQKLCFTDPYETMRITRYFGFGSFIALFIFLVLYFR